MGNLNLELMLQALDTAEQSPFGALTPEETRLFQSQFHLPDPGTYAVKLVQYAVALGAESIQVTSTLTRFEFVFDGAATKPEVFADLFSRFLRRKDVSVRDPLWHLAAGLFAASQEEPSQICFVSLSTDRAYKYVWNEQGLHHQTAKKFHEIYNNRITVYRTFSQIVELAKEEIAETLGLEPEEDSAEVQAIKAHCLYSPCDIRVNGVLLARPIFGDQRHSESGQEENLLAGRFAPRDLLLENAVAAERAEPASLGAPDSQASVKLCSADRFSTRQRAWLGVMAGLNQESEVVFVEDGVKLKEQRYELPCPGLMAVLSSELIPKDLTGFELLDGPDFKLQILWLKKEARRLAQELDFHDGKFPPPLQRRIASALDRTARRDIK